MVKIWFKRFICSFLALLVLGLNAGVCFAIEALPGEVSGGGTVSVGPISVDFGSLLLSLESYGHNELDYWGPRVKNKLYALIDEDVCGHNPNSDGRHHFESINTQINGKQGIYYICEYCGKSAGEVLEDVESEYVASLPAQAVNSDGELRWSPSLDDVVVIRLGQGLPNTTVSPSPITLNPENNFIYGNGSRYSYKRESDNRTIKVLVTVSNADGLKITAGYITFKLPIEGVYTADCNIAFEGNSDGINYLKYWVESTQTLFTETATFYYDLTLVEYSAKRNLIGYFYLPDFTIRPVVPISVNTTSDADIYNIGTRAASITGNFGIVNSGGTVSQIESQTIVNEGQHTVYNPITNETENFTDWNYDYSTRTYTLTQEGGDTTTVTYGDEYVTYSSGGNTQNIYYIMNTTPDSGNGGGNSGGGNTPANPPHRHQYSSVVTIEPNCTRSGVRTFTCDGCGASYTENIPAVGHAWEVVQDVKTQYDTETGELLQPGYSVYECTVCGQQYKSDNESMPPGIVGQDLQLQEASSNVLSLLPQLKPLYNGYLGMLQETFPYIPDEIMQLLYFGIASCVLIGIWKALRG